MDIEGSKSCSFYPSSRKINKKKVCLLLNGVGNSVTTDVDEAGLLNDFFPVKKSWISFFFFLARDRIWREVEEALVKELLKSWPMSVKSIYILGCQDTCLTSEHVLSSLQGHGYGTSFLMTGERQIVKKNKSCHPENHRLVSFTLIHRKIMGQVQLWVCEDGVAAWA